VEFIDAENMRDHAVELAAGNLPRLPEWINDAVDLLPHSFDFGRWNAPEGLRAVARLMVAPDEIAAVVATPERQRLQILPMGIDLSSISQAGADFLLAAAAVD
jgi:hypothetical protein